MNASATLSLNIFSVDSFIFKCSAVEKACFTGKARLLIVRSNPFKSKKNLNTKAGVKLLCRHISDKQRVLLACNSSDENSFFTKVFPSTVRRKSREAGKTISLPTLFPRGMFKATNCFRDYDCLILTSAGLFTTLEDIGMTLSLLRGKDVSWSEIKNEEDKKPAMHMGRFKDPGLHEIYVKKALGEIQQAIYRSALREGKDVLVVLALPDPYWLMELSKLMALEIVDMDGDENQKKRFTGLYDLYLLDVRQTVSKMDAAAMLGYTNEDAWHNNRRSIELMLSAYFDMKDHHAITRNSTV